MDETSACAMDTSDDSIQLPAFIIDNEEMSQDERYRILQNGKHLSNTFLDFDISETPPWSITETVQGQEMVWESVQAHDMSSETGQVQDMNCETEQVQDIIGKTEEVQDMKGTAGNVHDMVKEIVHLKRQYAEVFSDKDAVKKFRDDFILQMSHDEEVGIQDKKTMLAVTRGEYDRETFDENNSPTKNECLKNKITTKAFLETKNMFKTWKYFETLRKSDNVPLLSEKIVLHGHSILMKGLINDSGQISELDRYTICPLSLEKVNYPNPAFVKTVFPTILRYANDIAFYLRDRLQRDGPTEEIICQIVKFCAWFFASFVQLHPFSDGNGRMTRILYYHIQSLLSPFAVGVYNINTRTTKQDYLTAICTVREENKTSLLQTEENEYKKNNWWFASKPKDLARMILECQWRTWKDFEEKQKNLIPYERQLTQELITPPESFED